MQEETSQNANFILKKLKAALKIRTDIELSELLKIKPNTISSWKKRNTLDYGGIIALCESYGLDLNELFYDQPIAKNYSNTDEGTIMVSRESQFQYCLDSKTLGATLPKYSFPFLKGEPSRAFQVTGNNMFPLIEENAYAVCTETSIDIVRQNDLVVIISQSKGLFVNRLKFVPEDEDHFLLTNEYVNNHHMVIRKADIDEIWLVKAVLSFDISNSTKLKYLNDNLKIMDKVLAIIQ